MTIELSVVTYGNGDILREVFNAIAAAMNNNSTFYFINQQYILR